MKRILITGASGLLGRSLLKHCASHAEAVGTYLDREWKPENAKLYQLNVTKAGDTENLLDEVRPSVVVHAAGMTSIAECQENQQEAEEVNYRATAQLAAFCTQRGIRLIFLSTDRIFAGAKGNNS